MRPKLLDLFCGAGGAARGYQLAGFDVIGVDIADQPNYSGAMFVQGDALEFLDAHGHKFDAIHASPPCQSSSLLTKGTNKGRAYPDFIPATRKALAALGKPSVIENVVGADIRRDIQLCGEMFGLGVIRHRNFELGGWVMAQPPHIKHRGRVAGWRHGTYFPGPYFAVYGEGGGKGSLEEWRAAMGTPWMQTRHEIAESIPPAYSEHIGTQLLAQVLTAPAFA